MYTDFGRMKFRRKKSYKVGFYSLTMTIEQDTFTIQRCSPVENINSSLPLNILLEFDSSKTTKSLRQFCPSKSEREGYGYVIVKFATTMKQTMPKYLTSYQIIHA